MVVEEAADALTVLGREYTLQILEATEEPHSAGELSDELDIPIATCHRRLHELSELGFLESKEIKGQRVGQEITMYHRSVDRITFGFENELSMDTAGLDQQPLSAAWK